MRISNKSSREKAARDPVALKDATRAFLDEFRKRYPILSTGMILTYLCSIVLALWGAFQLTGMWPLGIAIILGVVWAAIDLLMNVCARGCPTLRDIAAQVDLHRYARALRSEILTRVLVFPGLCAFIWALGEAAGSDTELMLSFGSIFFRVLAAFMVLIVARALEYLLLACNNYLWAVQELEQRHGVDEHVATTPA